MSRLTSVSIKGRRDFALEGLDPKKLNLPPHVPDLPIMKITTHKKGSRTINIKCNISI